MPPRLPTLLPLLAAILAACGSAPEAVDGARMRDAFASMQASLAVVGVPPAAAAIPDAPAPAAPSLAVAPPVAPRMVALAEPAALPLSPAAPMSVAAPTPAPRPAPGGPGPQSAAQLLGKTPELLRLWLGEPALRRREGGNAEIWLYAAEACALDLVLYREQGGPLQVAFAAARAAGEATEAGTESACLGRIAAGLAARPAT